MGCVDNASGEGFGRGKPRQEEKRGSLATPCADTSIHHKLLYSYYAYFLLRVPTSAIPSGEWRLREQAVAFVGENCARFRFCARRFIAATLSAPPPHPILPDAATDRGYVADRITLRDALPRFILVLPCRRNASCVLSYREIFLKLVRNRRRNLFFFCERE